jgi:hypothetical protein
VTVTAASRHRRTKGVDAGRRHITGFEYADQNPDTQQTIACCSSGWRPKKPSNSHETGVS